MEIDSIVNQVFTINLTKLEDSPEPGRYSYTYEYDSSKKKDPKFTFGGSRNK